MNRDVSTGPLTRSLALLTQSLAPHCLLCSCALLWSFPHSLTHCLPSSWKSERFDVSKRPDFVPQCKPRNLNHVTAMFDRGRRDGRRRSAPHRRCCARRLNTCICRRRNAKTHSLKPRRRPHSPFQGGHRSVSR